MTETTNKAPEKETIVARAGVSIDFILEMENITCIRDENNNLLSDQEARERLLELKKQGIKII